MHKSFARLDSSPCIRDFYTDRNKPARYRNIIQNWKFSFYACEEHLLCTYHAGLTTRLSPANKIENKVSQILKSEKIIVSTAHIVWRIGTDSSAKYCIITFVENLTLFVTPVNFMSRKVTCPDFATGQFSSSRWWRLHSKCYQLWLYAKINFGIFMRYIKTECINDRTKLLLWFAYL